MKNAVPAKLLLVDDDPSQIQVMSRVLAGHGSLRFATGGRDALRLAREAPPDLILLDAEMPDMSGLQVCEALQDDAALAGVPVIFVTSHDDPGLEVAVLELGAVDFIRKPVNAAQVIARVNTQLKLKRMSDELRRLARADGLTGVANRRAFDEALDREWRRAQRSGQPLSLLIVDIDCFKLYNDRYGHPAGDRCLKAVAQALEAAQRRPGDLAARYGGEEFALLLPDTPVGGALHVGHEVLRAVEALDIAHAGSSVSRHVTVSVGLSCFDDSCAAWARAGADSRFGSVPSEGSADLVRAADQGLYAAKHEGRARACFLAMDDAAPPPGAGLDPQQPPPAG
jgi:diguanylate cyclase (GGDEF)-like protein